MHFHRKEHKKFNGGTGFHIIVLVRKLVILMLLKASDTLSELVDILSSIVSGPKVSR